MPAKANVLGVGVHATRLQEAVHLSDRLLQSGGKGYVCLTGVHGVMEARRNAGTRAILNRAALCLPDGMPMVWVGRLQGLSSMMRVYGPDYMMEVCRMSVARGYRHFLFGGDPGAASKLQTRLEELAPGIRIVGTYTPPYRDLNEREEEELRAMIQAAKPDILWVGLSTPKQERFMASHIETLEVRLMAGVGAAFDIHAGIKPDSPQWMKRAGLQWLDRLLREPGRLWPRYLRNNPAFLWQIGAQLLGLRRFSLE